MSVAYGRQGPPTPVCAGDIGDNHHEMEGRGSHKHTRWLLSLSEQGRFLLINKDSLAGVSPGAHEAALIYED